MLPSFDEEAWTLFGLFGLSLFALSLLVQWIISEKRRESVAPAVFWWLRIAGSAIMVVYFLHREELLGILGYGTGPFFYFRNLVLIHRKRLADREKVEAEVE